MYELRRQPWLFIPQSRLAQGTISRLPYGPKGSFHSSAGMSCESILMYGALASITAASPRKGLSAATTILVLRFGISFGRQEGRAAFFTAKIGGLAVTLSTERSFFVDGHAANWVFDRGGDCGHGILSWVVIEGEADLLADKHSASQWVLARVRSNSPTGRRCRQNCESVRGDC